MFYFKHLNLFYKQSVCLYVCVFVYSTTEPIDLKICIYAAYIWFYKSAFSRLDVPI